MGLGRYIKEAFKVQYNLILLAGGFAAGILSLHPLMVWPIVAGVEILYLLSLAQSTRFQRLVDVKGQVQAADPSEVARRLEASLSIARKRRFQEVRARCLDLQASQRSGSQAGQVQGLIQGQQLEGVNKLLWVFLRTLAQEQVLDSFCATMPRGEIQATLKRSDDALAATDLSEEMKAAYTENREVLGKRLDNLKRAEDNLKAIQARLVRVENSIMLIQEQALTRGDPNFVEAEVRSVTAGLSSVEEMMQSMNLPKLDAVGDEITPELLRVGQVPPQVQGR